LVALEDRLSHVGAVVVPGIGVQNAVPKEVEGGAMELVTAALRHHADDTSVCLAILCVERSPRHLHFLYSINRGSCQPAAPVARLAGHAVNEDGGGFVTPSVEGKSVVILVLRRLRDACPDGNHARGCPYQDEWIAHVRWQFSNGAFA